MIIPVGFSQVSLLFTGTGVPLGAATTFGVLNVNDAPPDDIAEDIRANIVAIDLLQRISNTITLTTVRVKNGPNGTGPMAEVGGTDAGDTAGDTSPNCALLITKNTGVGGRAGRGRMFFPGIVEADVATGGYLTSTALTDFAAAFTAFHTMLGTLDLPMVLLHADASNTPDLVTSLTVSERIATQRRRLRR